MGWWGKLVGGAFGFVLGGPIGALLGAVLGHQLDRGLGGGVDWPGGDLAHTQAERERVQTAFFTTTFAVLGHIAKADGRVTKDEISLAEAVMAHMDLEPELRQAAIRLFNQGKNEDFPLDAILLQFKQECHRRQDLIRIFIEIQLQAAYADGNLAPEEERLLLHLCRRLGFSETLFRQLEAMVRAEYGMGAGTAGGMPPSLGRPSLEQAYAILNLSPEATDEEVKRAYRRLRSQHHPDKLVSKGLPEEMMRLANEKTQEIQAAYERLREARGL